jgi:hypothetical protein
LALSASCAREAIFLLVASVDLRKTNLSMMIAIEQTERKIIKYKIKSDPPCVTARIFCVSIFMSSFVDSQRHVKV